MDNEVMRERMIRDANHDTMMSILHKKASMGEGEAAYDQDHDKIMAMLHRRIATGEGDEYGGWIKPLNKSQYIKMMTSKGRGYTKKQAEALWKKLQAKRRKEKAMVKKGKVTVKKMLKVSKKKSANSWIQFSKDMARENPGLSRSELSELYWLSKDYDKPIKKATKKKATKKKATKKKATKKKATKKKATKKKATKKKATKKKVTKQKEIYDKLVKKVAQLEKVATTTKQKEIYDKLVKKVAQLEKVAK
jgi:hypothetical protein